MKHQTRNLSLLSERRLNAYAVAATAAGVGALCLAHPAEAKIVYTPANRKIPQNSVVLLDLNHDGIPDFRLHNSYFIRASSSYPFAELDVKPKNGNEIWDGVRSCQSGYVCAEALPKGRRIGPKGPFQGNSGLLVEIGRVYQFGQWLVFEGEVQAYLGLKFAIKGKTHFGWARVKVRDKGWSFTTTLTGYAYETVPGKPIIAGATKGPEEQAGSLGVLAAGAVGR